MVDGVLNSYMDDKDLEALRNENRRAAVDAFSPSAQNQRDEEQHPSPRAFAVSFDTTPDNAHPTQILPRSPHFVEERATGKSQAYG
jgi:hypothetical protein